MQTRFENQARRIDHGQPWHGSRQALGIFSQSFLIASVFSVLIFLSANAVWASLARTSGMAGTGVVQRASPVFEILLGAAVLA